MVSNAVSLNASSYKTLFNTSSGTLSVPVKPSAVVYSQFAHVHGVSAGSGQNGVPLSRVRILNTLIDQLVSMKSKNVNPDEDVQQMTDDQKDALIRQYQQEIKNTITLASQNQAATYSIAGLMPEPGAVFSITA